jgi:hypothetical protein
LEEQIALNGKVTRPKQAARFVDRADLVRSSLFSDRDSLAFENAAVNGRTSETISLNPARIRDAIIIQE